MKPINILLSKLLKTMVTRGSSTANGSHILQFLLSSQIHWLPVYQCTCLPSQLKGRPVGDITYVNPILGEFCSSSRSSLPTLKKIIMPNVKSYKRKWRV
jgi:hypothetical protein